MRVLIQQGQHVKISFNKTKRRFGFIRFCGEDVLIQSDIAVTFLGLVTDNYINCNSPVLRIMLLNIRRLIH